MTCDDRKFKDCSLAVCGIETVVAGPTPPWITTKQIPDEISPPPPLRATDDSGTGRAGISGLGQGFQ